VREDTRSASRPMSRVRKLGLTPPLCAG
jgi:hypothetical protein